MSSGFLLPGAAHALDAEAVVDDEDGGQGHRGGGDEGVQEPGSSDRDRGDVVSEGPAEVGADGAEGLAGDRDRIRDDVDVVADEDDVRGFEGDVGAGHEREPEVLAVARAMASLMPSPTIATFSPAAWSSRATSAFWGRGDAGVDVFDAEFGRDAEHRQRGCRR